MMTFWIIGALMLAVAMLFVVLPLWRGSVKSNQVRRDAANLEIFRDQIAEMDTDLRNGLLTQEMHAQGKNELQARMLDEVGETQQDTASKRGTSYKALALALIVLLPLFAVALYWKIGNSDAMRLQTEAEQGYAVLQSDAELNELESRLAANPQNAEGWYQLARSYTELGRYPDAVRAFDALTKLVPTEAQLWADYADALAMASGQTLKGQPTQLLDKALALDPQNMKALALSGSAALERGDYAVSVRQWEKLLQMIPPESDNARMIEAGINKARERLAQGGAKPAKTQSAAGTSISGTVTLSAALQGKADPEDTVFVLARAAEGPKMPLAIIRKQVKDLPLKFTLDDTTAMSPQMKLSGFAQVVVVARISKSGNAATQAGDLQVVSEVIKPGAQGLKLQINQLIK